MPLFYLRYLSCLLFFPVLLLFSLPGFGAQNLRILLTNDDGFESPGIRAVQEALRREGHDVFVIAPATQQSGKGGAITGRGVHFTAHPGQVWSVNGTPSDAVRLGLGYIMFNNPPDLVVSGANFGQNTGQDVHISGTVGAALSAFRLGIPAIAISVAIKLDEAESGFPSTVGALSGAARVTARLIRNLDLSDLTSVLNVNYPAELPLDVKGVRWTPLSQHSIIGTRYYRQADGTYAPELQEPHPNARAYDAESVLDGYVTMTFLDGEMATTTSRGQRYLARDLLDEDYEPTYTPRTPGTPVKPERERQPMIPGTPEPRLERAPSGNETITMPEPRRTLPETRLRERSPRQPVIRLGTPPPATSDQVEKETGRREQRIPIREEVITLPEDAPPQRRITTPDSGQAPPQEQLPPPTQEERRRAEEKTRNEETESRKDEPDSWLRRMFDPSSWRR